MLHKLLKSFFVVLALSTLCPATTQIRDRLIYINNEYFLDYDEFPFEDYWSDENPKPECLHMGSTACWRGYIATWEVRNGSLFLKSLDKESSPNKDETVIPLQNIFPDVNGPILADWYSGVLKCDKDEMHKELLFISINKGKVLGTRKATWEQVKNPPDKDLSWSSLLPSNGKTRAIRAKKWWLQSTRWIDGESIFRRDDPTQSGKSFKIRGIYFPGGKLWTTPISCHFLLEIPDSVKSPTTVTPVEVTAKSQKSNYYFLPEQFIEQSPTKGISTQVVTQSKEDFHCLIVSHIKVLPVGTAIQRATDNINMTIECIIIMVLIILVLGMFGIGIFGRKEGISFWKFWFTGSYTSRNMHGYIKAELVKPFLIINWLSVLFFLALIVYLYFFG